MAFPVIGDSGLDCKAKADITQNIPSGRERKGLYPGYSNDELKARKRI
jgi:hypothetical protein